MYGLWEQSCRHLFFLSAFPAESDASVLREVGGHVSSYPLESRKYCGLRSGSSRMSEGKWEINSRIPIKELTDIWQRSISSQTRKKSEVRQNL